MTSSASLPEGGQNAWTEPSVAAGYPRAFLDFAASKGASRQALLKRSGLNVEDLAQQDSRIPLRAYAALVDAGIELVGEPALALRFAEQVKPEDVTIVALITMASETAMEALRQMGRYARLLIDAGDKVAAPPGHFAHEDDGFWVVSTDAAYARYPRLAEIMLIQNICGGRRALGASWPGLLVHFPHPAPAYRAEFERIVGAPISFSSTRFAVRVSPEILTKKLPTANRYVFGQLSERAEALLKDLEHSKTVRGAVERLLASRLHTGEIGIEAIASRMSVSQKTLYRRLKAEGVTFEQVLDVLRHRLALSFLTDRKVSVNETAYLIGFSDPAAFSRAFKRWTGTNPSTARNPGDKTPT